MFCKFHIVGSDMMFSAQTVVPSFPVASRDKLISQNTKVANKVNFALSRFNVINLSLNDLKTPRNNDMPEMLVIGFCASGLDS